MAGSSSITSTVPDAPVPSLATTGMGVAPGSATTAGIRTVNVVPTPASLVTVIVPPIISQNILLITRPRPVPPYFLAVDASACANALKRRPSCSGVMPIPVSRTVSSIQSTCPSVRRAPASVTVPRSVNLLALESRLKSTCRTRVTSAWMIPISGSSANARTLPFFSISGATVDATASIASDRSKSSRWSSILPASILERSSTSLISASR